MMAGHDGCGNFMLVLIIIAFISHALGIVNPFWFCKGTGCSIRGLYYTCSLTETVCSRDVPSQAVLVIAVIILVSNFVLLLTICCLLQCCYLKYYNITRSYAITLGIWFQIQETLTMAVLITCHVIFTRVGWAAYMFTVPGVMMFFIMAAILAFKYVWPKKRRAVENVPVHDVA